MKTIAVILEGGIVRCAVSTEEMDDIQIMVVDYDDAFDCVPEDVTMVPQGDSTEAPAYVSIVPVEAAHIDIKKTLYRCENDIHPTEEGLDDA